jgi:ligand-binding sensor domain-containing protein
LETTSHQAFPIGSCFAFAEDSQGNVWMGSEVGLFIYRYATEEVISYVHEENNDSSLSENDVRSIYISKDDEVWIGTNNGGLNHYNASSSSFTSFTTDNGLPNNSIYTILEDHHGYLWLGTNGGICRFDKADHSVRNYTPRDGIQNYEFNTNAVAMIHDGRFCFGGRTGFNIFHPDSMNVTLKPSPVVISNSKSLIKSFR